MGVCMECRLTVDDRAHRRSCLQAVQPGMDLRREATVSANPAPAIDSRRLEVDLAIVGGGPAGLAAACAAVAAGRRVAVLDEGEGGGQIWRHRLDAGSPARAAPYLQVRDAANVKWFPRTTVTDAVPGHLWASTESGALEVSYESLVLACGCRELFLPFPGWTLPGVMGVGGLQALLKAGLEPAGRPVVIAGSGPLLLPVAALTTAAGADLRLVAEQASAARLARFAAGLWRWPKKWSEGLRYRGAFRGTPFRTGVWVVAAKGDERLEEVELSDGRRRWSEPCDLLAAAYGLVPNLELAQLLGCALDRKRVAVDQHLRTSQPGIWCAGEVTGVGGAELALLEGKIAGLAATDQATPDRLLRKRHRYRRFTASLERAFAPRPELRDRLLGDTIVCRCEDVTWGALEPAWQRRQAKLYSRLGMGPCQGRICGPATDWLLGWPADTVRSPLLPTPISHLMASSDRSSTS
nr:hydrogen cyanide synthase subunit HcnB-like [Nerophis lumbriciformis]